MKAKKRKLADVRVYACVREESWGGASQTRLVFFDSPRVSSRISGDLDSIVEKRGQTYCIREIKWYLCKQHDLPRFPIDQRTQGGLRVYVRDEVRENSH